MPLVKRSVSPVQVSRNRLPSNVRQEELQCVANGSLANLVRQLSSLSKHAENIFGELFHEALKIEHKADSLTSRVERLKVKVTQLESSSEEVSLQDLHLRKAFKSSSLIDQQSVSRHTLPAALAEIYSRCDLPPDLDKLNIFRDDDKSGLKFYTDPDYFFELWRQEMLKDAENAHGRKPHKPKVPGDRKRHKQPRQPPDHKRKFVEGAIRAGEAIQYVPPEYQPTDIIRRSGGMQAASRVSVNNAPPPGMVYRPESLELHGRAPMGGAVLAPANSGSSGYGSSISDQHQNQQHYATAVNNSGRMHAGAAQHPGGSVRSTVSSSGHHHVTAMDIQYAPAPTNGARAAPSAYGYQSQQQQQMLGSHQYFPSQPPAPGSYHYGAAGYALNREPGATAPHGATSNALNGRPSTTQQAMGNGPSTPTARNNLQQVGSPASTGSGDSGSRGGGGRPRPSQPPPAPPLASSSESGGSRGASQSPKPGALNGDLLHSRFDQLSLDQQTANGLLYGDPSMPDPASLHRRSASPDLPPPPPPLQLHMHGFVADSTPSPPPPPAGMYTIGGPSSHATGAGPPRAVDTFSSAPPPGGIPPPPPPPPPPPGSLALGPLRKDPPGQHAPSPQPDSASPSGGVSSPKALGAVSDARSDLLKAIQQGIKLRKVEAREEAARQEESAAHGHDVAAILMQRWNAVAMSDSEDTAEDDGHASDWSD